jgi:predicted nucleic-acid-binding Zn-ribbon protein
MYVNRPPAYIPYGPVGHPNARFFFNCEGATEEEALKLLDAVIFDTDRKSVPRNTATFNRESWAEEGYFALLVIDSQVNDAAFQALPVPPMFQPALPGERGRKLEDFPHTVAGYYQHYDYEPLTNLHPDCDHDFGLESVRYGFKEDQAEGATLVKLEDVDLQTMRGRVFLAVTCTRCGDTHGLLQQTASGVPDLN